MKGPNLLRGPKFLLTPPPPIKYWSARPCFNFDICMISTRTNAHYHSEIFPHLIISNYMSNITSIHLYPCNLMRIPENFSVITSQLCRSEAERPIISYFYGASDLSASLPCSCDVIKGKVYYLQTLVVVTLVIKHEWL